MAIIIDDISRTFDEYLLLPNLTKKENSPSNVDLNVPIQRNSNKNQDLLHAKLPVVSSAMQAVTGSKLAISLAKKGGIGFIYCSQSIEEQAKMVREVKEHKAGFVESDSNLPPNATLQDVINLKNKTGHSTIAITEDGALYSKLLGLLTSKDYWEFKDDLRKPVTNYYTPIDKLIFGMEGITYKQATDILWHHKKECLPIIDNNGCLTSLVFRKDYFDHIHYPNELTDENKRLIVGAALNTHDYKERGPAMLEAGADCLCLDSSDGFSEWQKEAAIWLRKKCGENIIIGGGNVVSADGFMYLVKEAKLDFVKVGIGGGSICITREQKGIGRGQASAVMDVARARDEYFKETGIYIPICSDGGLSNDTHIIMALAMGADFVMMGRYFAMTEESPTPKINYKGGIYKPYWGEGSNRARNWERYTQSEKEKLIFEEGVDAYVPYSGPLSEKLDTTVSKLKSTMCNVGAMTIKEFHEKARLTQVSPMTLVESGTSNVLDLDRIQTSTK